MGVDFWWAFSVINSSTHLKITMAGGRHIEKNSRKFLQTYSQIAENDEDNPRNMTPSENVLQRCYQEQSDYQYNYNPVHVLSGHRQQQPNVSLNAPHIVNDNQMCRLLTYRILHNIHPGGGY